MAAKSTTVSKPAAASTLESMDKLTSSTLKRNPKMELSKADLLKLLSYLEGELQAREIVIATLKAEKVKQLLQQVKLGGYNMDNPIVALQRDAFAACSPGFDEMAVRAIYSNQLLALETLIDAQRCAHYQMKDQMGKVEQRHAKVLQELDDEKCKHAHDTAQGDDVTYLLEKERGRLKQEVELERQHNKKVEKEMKKIAAILEQERAKQKQIVLLLLAERKRIIIKLLEERQRCLELEKILQLEKGRMADMVDGLEEESQKSLQMEAELEQQLALFEEERNRLKEAIAAETDKSAKLQDVNQCLALEVQTLKQKTVEGQDAGSCTPSSQISRTDFGISPDKPNASATSKQTVPPTPPSKPNSGTAIKSAAGSPATACTPPRVVSRVQKVIAAVDDKQKTAENATPSQIGGTKIVQSAVTPGLTVTSKPVQGPVHSVACAQRTVCNASEKPNNLIGQVEKPTPNPNAVGNKIFAAGSKSPSASPTTPPNTNQPPQPPKKPVAVVRGTPPPVPPNKPILLAQARVIGARSVEGDGKLTKPGMKLTKDKIVARSTDANDAVKPSASEGGQVGSLLPPTTSMDLLGQELADFQQLLVSMVNGKGIEMLSADQLTSHTSENTS